ncbi:hypothetical protein DYB37_010876 [Aphanomyces astaci]|uniref:WRKY19-like zinc finger domain-containing protein n=1 Tax=Aphanomyces astaci TaxID=112090 RepID=A0A418E163_APHAT|nr:hypothetical protein DYB35_005323 [Aphanomyces astaci]RHZ03902.1 hypothetical protein DYB37_010876 [Aphanomyces astaci]
MDIHAIHPIPFMNPMMMSAYAKPSSFEFMMQQASPASMYPPMMMMNNQYEPAADTLDSDASSMQDLLEYALFNDEVKPKGGSTDGDSDLEVTEEFDNKEIDILYTFLMDRSPSTFIPSLAVPTPIVHPNPTTFDPNSGVISLNLLDESPLGAYLDGDDECDEELLNMQLVAPPQFDTQAIRMKSNDTDSWTDDSSETNAHDKNRRLCKMTGCQRRSRSHGLCISHGGGRRCAVDGCGKSSQGGNLCIKHGGGKRCEMEDCNRAAQSNNLCKAHGGGPRCLFDGCDRSSQGGGYCRSHGGGKRCLFEGCDKGTQRGEFCALHGGSRLCGVSGCMRNDRGGGFCATHGGGKRCRQEGCEKPCRRRGMCSAHIRLLDEK